MLEDALEIDLSSKEILEEFYAIYPPPHSDLSIGNIICWRDYSKVMCLPMGRNMAFLIRTQNEEYVVPPLGPPNYGVIMDVLKCVEREGVSLLIYGSQNLSLMKDYFPGLETVPVRAFFDYVYLTRNLAEMKGKDYLKIRNELNNFMRCYDAIAEPIKEDDIKEVKGFAKRWCIWKDCEAKKMLKFEKKALFYALEHFPDLPLEGILLRVDDRIEAISIFERLSPDTFVVHFEKANYNLKGCYPRITRVTAESLLNRCYFLNREGDMGVPGLRRAKLKLKPHHFVAVHSVERPAGEIK